MPPPTIAISVLERVAALILLLSFCYHDRYVANAFDTPGHDIPGNNRTHAFRCPGIDDVAGYQLHVAGEVGDYLRHAPNQLGQVAVLLELAIELEPDRALLDRLPSGRYQWRAGRRLIETLAKIPGSPLFARGDLQVATCHIDAGRIAENMLHPLLNRNVATALTDRDNQLHLILKIGRFRLIGNRTAARHDCVGGFHEKERQLTIGVEAHFAGMCGIVPADTIDAAHGKSIRAIGDR